MKKAKLKNVLFPPYKYTWPAVETDTENRVLSKLQDVFATLPCLKPKRPQMGKKTTQETDSETDKHRKMIRSMLAVGVNEVIRSLEKDHLAALLVCRSAQPALLTQPLISLAAARQCPALALTNLASRLAPTLGMTSLLALGIKKERGDGTFDSVVELITSVAVPLNIPGLKKMKANPIGQKPASESSRANADKVAVDTQADALITGQETVAVAEEISHGGDSSQVDPKATSASKTAPATDYSYLYVYKKPKPQRRKLEEEFIPLGGEEKTVVDPEFLSLKYVPCDVGTLMANSQRERKRKKMKKN